MTDNVAMEGWVSLLQLTIAAITGAGIGAIVSRFVKTMRRLTRENQDLMMTNPNDFFTRQERIQPF